MKDRAFGNTDIQEPGQESKAGNREQWIEKPTQETARAEEKR